MNNPRRIQFTKENVTEYIYTAEGEKLRTILISKITDSVKPRDSNRNLLTVHGVQVTVREANHDHLNNTITVSQDDINVANKVQS